MPININWLDALIALTLIISLFSGLKTGLIRSIFNIAGLVAGIAVAMKYFDLMSSFLLLYINLPSIATDVFSFILIFSLTVATVYLAGSIIHSVTNFSIIRFVDKLGGSTAGLAIGILIVGILLILLTSFPVYAEFPEQVEQSTMAPTIIDVTTTIYDELSTFLPFKLPRIATYPESLGNYISSVNAYTDHQGVDFEALDRATCFACGEEVNFLGYLANGRGSISPKFTCSGCGRTSDGCQTYEGYHEMYEVCPVELAKQGYRFDCGIWANRRYVKPEGTCVVCGTGY